MIKRLAIALAVTALLSAAHRLRAETECNGNGDVRDFRYQGEVIHLTSNIRFDSPDGSQTGQASLQGQPRDGTHQTFIGNLAFGATPGAAGIGGRARGGGGPALRVQLNDASSDTTTFDLDAISNTPLALGGLYFWLNLDGGTFAGSTAEPIMAGATAAKDGESISLAGAPPNTGHFVDATVQSIRFSGAGNCAVEMRFASPTHIVVQQAPGAGRGGRGGAPAGYSLYFPIGTDTLGPGTPFHASFTLKATCDLDKAPVTLTLDPSRTGPSFAGVGGNFRIQSNNDAASIAYNLANLQVSWARLEMPLSSWQTSESADPATAPLANNVRQAMEMARTLSQKKIPMIISDWSAPNWAVAQNGTTGGGAGGMGARTIADDAWPAMYKGIVSYLEFLKKNYGAEPALFSFNEADQGINVKLSPDDQRLLIRELGPQLAAAGLATKMLLGDTGNPTPRPADFLEPTLADPEAMKYVGAISYHSWTGGSDQVLAHWGDIAQRNKIPLLVAEGGTDPNSYRYRSLFLEPWYALDEANLYVRCLEFSQPASILHWQFTDDYSILAGGRGQPLQPTQRFFNLKQMSLAPPEAPSVPIDADRPGITAAAYGDAVHGYAIHLINTGATRQVTLKGLPPGLKQLFPTVTDGTRGMEPLPAIDVANGQATLSVDFQSFVTLTSTKP